MGEFDKLRKLVKLDGAIEYSDKVVIQTIASHLQCLPSGTDSLIQNKSLTLIIEGDHASSWDELNGINGNVKCTIQLNKNKVIDVFLRSLIKTDNTISCNLFFSIDSFEKWTKELPSPFSSEHPFYKCEKSVIWIDGLEEQACSSHLIITGTQLNLISSFEDTKSTLPNDESIRKQVHFISSESINIDPVRFSLPLKFIRTPFAKFAFINYQKLLTACLVKEFFNEDKVVISGVKRIESKLMENQTHLASREEISLLEECVAWAYSSNTTAKLVLLMDRISLDVSESGIIPSIFIHLKSAFSQASYRYEFVVKDRKEAHAKELIDLQKDIRSATESYSKSATELVSGLLKDALSAIFVIAISLFSRFIGKSITDSDIQLNVLFYGLAIYLLISVGVRVYLSSVSLSMSLKDLEYWKDTARNHMSSEEFKTHISARTSGYKTLFKYSCIAVVAIYLLLAAFVFSIPKLSAFAPTERHPEKSLLSESVDSRDGKFMPSFLLKPRPSHP